MQACAMSSSEPSALPMDCSLSLWCLRPMHLRCVISGLLRWLLCYRHFFPKSACSRESTTYTWWSYHALILHRQSVRISERGSIDEHLLESFSSTQIYPQAILQIFRSGNCTHSLNICTTNRFVPGIECVGRTDVCCS